MWVGSIAAIVLASGRACVWTGQWHKSSASWSGAAPHACGRDSGTSRARLGPVRGLTRGGASRRATRGLQRASVGKLQRCTRVLNGGLGPVVGECRKVTALHESFERWVGPCCNTAKKRVCAEEMMWVVCVHEVTSTPN